MPLRRRVGLLTGQIGPDFFHDPHLFRQGHLFERQGNFHERNFDFSAGGVKGGGVFRKIRIRKNSENSAARSKNRKAFHTAVRRQLEAYTTCDSP